MGEKTSSGQKCGLQGKKETVDYGKNTVTEKRQRRGPDLADLVGHRHAEYPKTSEFCCAVGARPVKANRVRTERQDCGGTGCGGWLVTRRVRQSVERVPGRVSHASSMSPTQVQHIPKLGEPDWDRGAWLECRIQDNERGVTAWQRWGSCIERLYLFVLTLLFYFTFCF